MRGCYRVRAKEKENKGAKEKENRANKDEHRSFWCNKGKVREITWVGHVYAKGNSELMTHLTTFSFSKFTHHPL